MNFWDSGPLINTAEIPIFFVNSWAVFSLVLLKLICDRPSNPHDVNVPTNKQIEIINNTLFVLSPSKSC